MNPASELTTDIPSNYQAGSSLPRDPVRDARFIALLDACRPSGGLARIGEVGLRAAKAGCCTPDLRTWISQRRLFVVDWNRDRWVPLFQLDLACFVPRAAVALVLAELGPIYDGWELADWFCTPNASLAELCPASAISGQPAAVVNAARMLRFGTATQ